MLCTNCIFICQYMHKCTDLIINFKIIKAHGFIITIRYYLFSELNIKCIDLHNVLLLIIIIEY